MTLRNPCHVAQFMKAQGVEITLNCMGENLGNIAILVRLLSLKIIAVSNLQTSMTTGVDHNVRAHLKASINNFNVLCRNWRFSLLEMWLQMVAMLQ